MTDYQATYNGLTFGAGTSIQILKATGLEDLPAVRSTDRNRPRDTGEFAGNDYADGRDITLDLLILDGGQQGVNDFWTNVEALKAATIPQGNTTTLPLAFNFPGRSGRQVYCRPRKRDLPTDLNFQFKYGQASIQFHAVDPRWYDTTLQQVVANAPVAVTGLTFNATFDLSFGGAATGGYMYATNSGNVESRPTTFIQGTCVNPTITNVTTGQSLTFNISLASTDILVVDHLNRTVLLNGTTNRYNTIAPLPQWWTIVPGNNTLQFSTASGSGVCLIAFRNAWL